MSISKPVTRRESLLAGLFGTGYIGLRALATGLPPWFLLNPRRATAQDLQCMLNAQNNNQYLILSTSSNGDPINCNCPGTYENTSLIHPSVDEMTATKVTVGGQMLGAALPWADPSVTTTGGSQGVPHLVGAGADVVLPLHDRHRRARRPAEGHEDDGGDVGRRDDDLGVRQAPGGLLRHGADGAHRRRRGRQRGRAGQLLGAHAPVDHADAAEDAADGDQERSAGDHAGAAGHGPRQPEHALQERVPGGERAGAVPRRAVDVADAGALAGQSAGDDAGQHHRQRPERAAVGGGRAHRGQGDAGGDRPHLDGGRQPLRQQPAGGVGSARQRHHRDEQAADARHGERRAGQPRACSTR